MAKIQRRQLSSLWVPIPLQLNLSVLEPPRYWGAILLIRKTMVLTPLVPRLIHHGTGKQSPQATNPILKVANLPSIFSITRSVVETQNGAAMIPLPLIRSGSQLSLTTQLALPILPSPQAMILQIVTQSI